MAQINDEPEVSANMALFLERVYAICHEIPRGHVTSYGHIAKLAGYPRHARHVGNAMKALPDGSTVPWQRVIASTGYISPRGDNGTGAERQMERLTEEGVEVTDMGGNGVTINGRGGRYRVSLAQYGWFPESLAR